MRHVGFDGTIFGMQRVGGVSTYAWELLRRLSEVPDLQLTLSLPSRLISDRADELQALPAKIKMQATPVQIARRLPIDLPQEIVHSPYYRVPLSRRPKYIVTVHDFVYARYRTGLARLVHCAQMRYACLRADAIICVSTNTRSDLLADYPDLDTKKVTVVPHGVDHTNFYVPPKKRNDLSDTVIFIGNRKRYKRFDLAVEAASMAEKRLAFIGEKPDQEDRALLERHLQGRWTALGSLPDDVLREVYAGAFALIYPSDYEGFGIPILEAQACGCPTIVANRSSFPEVGGEASLYASAQVAEDYASCLMQLDDSTFRDIVIAKGIANAARFDWKATFERTLEVYAQTLAS